MANAPDTEILRFGKWFSLNKWQYVTTLDFIIPMMLSQGGAQTQITFEKRSANVLTAEGLETMFMDYDKYIDDRLVI